MGPAWRSRICRNLFHRGSPNCTAPAKQNNYAVRGGRGRRFRAPISVSSHKMTRNALAAGFIALSRPKEKFALGPMAIANLSNEPRQRRSNVGRTLQSDRLTGESDLRWAIR